MSTGLTRREVMRSTLLVGAGLTGLGWRAGLARAAQPTLPELRVGWQAVSANLPMPVAMLKGYDREFGFRIKRFFTLSGPQLNEALAAGEIDAANMSAIAALLSAARGLPVKLVVTRGHGGDINALMVRKGSQIRGLRELVGRKIALTVGSSAHQFVELAARAEGLTLAQFTVQNMLLDAMPAALATGQVDAVAVWEPNITSWAKKGVGEVILRGGKYFRNHNAILLKDSIIKSQWELGYRFVLATLKAMHFIRTDRTGESMALGEQDLKIDRALLGESLKYSVMDPRMPRAFYEDLRVSLEFLERLGRLRRPIKLEEFVYEEYMARAQKEHPEFFSDLPA
ncbi:MAG: NrtA/SsuA/CpmA family ABC transporter substrate-binding protein [Deltaproteobacteria bacterium]|nr:NrtA/SsuA/CpmA family ABC transporter substrate-binding protein [Deltaproteobacteria bacterium]